MFEDSIDEAHCLDGVDHLLLADRLQTAPTCDYLRGFVLVVVVTEHAEGSRAERAFH